MVRLLLNILRSVMLQVHELLYHFATVKMFYFILTVWGRVLEKLPGPQLRNLLHFVQPVGTLLYSKQPLFVPILTQINPIYTHLIYENSC